MARKGVGACWIMRGIVRWDDREAGSIVGDLEINPRLGCPVCYQEPAFVVLLLVSGSQRHPR